MSLPIRPSDFAVESPMITLFLSDYPSLCPSLAFFLFSSYPPIHLSLKFTASLFLSSMISETAGIRGLLCQLPDHQDLTVEEKCQWGLCVQRVWPLSEAPFGKGELRKITSQRVGRGEEGHFTSPPTDHKIKSPAKQKGASAGIPLRLRADSSPDQSAHL